MKIGYPCINNSIDGTANSTFRIKSYSREKLIEVVEKNLASLMRILQFNLENDLLFFRIGSGIIPFASHPICDVDWREIFKLKLAEIGKFIKIHDMRISMHPDQFVVLNSPTTQIVQNSVDELKYQCAFLDSLGLASDAKLQIHVGGMYGDKITAIERFIQTYNNLPSNVKDRLVIENDDRLFSVKDCLSIHRKIGIPIIFDNLHFNCLNDQESMLEAFKLTAATWQSNDGLPMIDYSTQEPGGRLGKHTNTIDIEDFERFLNLTKDFNFDIMLEIKDKEASALKAYKTMKKVRKN